MIVCVPTADDRSLDSAVSSHFRSAPVFVVVDTVSGLTRWLRNERRRPKAGNCERVQALEGEHIDVFLVGGIGLRALAELHEGGARVFAVRGGSAAEALAAFAAGALEPLRAPR